MREENEAYRLEDMIEVIPSWYERWGISVMATVFLMFLLMAGIIRYPTVLTAGIDIATSTPPVNVYARQSGNYVPFIGEGTQVEANAPIGIILNPVKHKDILQVKTILESTVQKGDYRLLDGLDKSLVLGGMQDLYSQLIEDVERHNYLTASSFPMDIQRNLETQIEQTESLKAVLTHKRKLIQEQQELYDRKNHRDSMLYHVEGISQQDIELSRAELLKKRETLENITIEIQQNQLQNQKLREALLNISKENNDGHFQSKIRLQESIKRMLGAISNWEQNYLISAPINGRVTYLKKFAVNQFINPDEALLSVVPENGMYVGKITLPVEGSGKVKAGQAVKIKLDHFPYQEYGLLEGTVTEVSLVPNKGNYLISVSMDNQLTTSYNISIPFKQHLSGSASVITEDLSLLQRIFGQIRALFDKKIQLGG